MGKILMWQSVLPLPHQYHIYQLKTLQPPTYLCFCFSAENLETCLNSASNIFCYFNRFVPDFLRNFYNGLTNLGTSWRDIIKMQRVNTQK